MFIHSLGDFPAVNLIEMCKSTILGSFSEGKLWNFISVFVMKRQRQSHNVEVNAFEANPPPIQELGKWCQVLPGCLCASCDPGSQQGDTSTGQGMMALGHKRNGGFGQDSPNIIVSPILMVDNPDIWLIYNPYIWLITLIFG